MYVIPYTLDMHGDIPVKQNQRWHPCSILLFTCSSGLWSPQYFQALISHEKIKANHMLCYSIYMLLLQADVCSAESLQSQGSRRLTHSHAVMKSPSHPSNPTNTFPWLGSKTATKAGKPHLLSQVFQSLWKAPIWRSLPMPTPLESTGNTGQKIRIWCCWRQNIGGEASLRGPVIWLLAAQSWQQEFRWPHSWEDNHMRRCLVLIWTWSLLIYLVPSNSVFRY